MRKEIRDRQAEIIKEFAENNIKIEKRIDEMWRECAEFGILAALVPEKVGGMAKNYSEILQTAYMVGKYFKDNGITFAINNSMIVASYVLPMYGDKKLISQLYPDLLNGKLIAAYAITESQSGSDVFNMKTNVVRRKDHLILNGAKTYISNGPIADIFVVIAQNEENTYTALLVQKNDKGVEIGKPIEKMGLEHCPMSEIYFTHCILPKSRIIGEYNWGQIISNMTLDWERALSFASHLGTMDRIINQCLHYANARQQFGRRIGDYQLIAEKLVKMKIDLETGKLWLDKIGKMKDRGKKTYLETSIFKYLIGESYANCCLEALQIHGAYGYSKESGFEKEVRDALAAKIYSGTSEIQIDIISQLMGVR